MYRFELVRRSVHLRSSGTWDDRLSLRESGAVFAMSDGIADGCRAASCNVPRSSPMGCRRTLPRRTPPPHMAGGVWGMTFLARTAWKTSSREPRLPSASGKTGRGQEVGEAKRSERPRGRRGQRPEARGQEVCPLAKPRFSKRQAERRAQLGGFQFAEDLRGGGGHAQEGAGGGVRAAASDFPSLQGAQGDL